MNVDLLTNGVAGEKPWLNIVCNSCNTLYTPVGLVPSWNGALGALPYDNFGYATPAGTGGGNITYSPVLNEVLISGLVGVNTSAFTLDGYTWTQILTSPTNNPMLVWSPVLNYYGYIQVSGTGIYTSVDHVVYVAGTPAPGAFNGADFIWSTLFSKFYADTTDPAHRIYSSPDGKVYTALNSDREVNSFAESPELKILVAVGANGPQYTTDGINWIDSSATFSASGVCWSDSNKIFVTVPAGGTRTECWRSSDGINWTVTYPFSGLNNIRTILWAQDIGLFISAGDNAYIAFSFDGLVWRRGQSTGAYASYGGLYVYPWGQYFLSGIGLIVATGGRYFQPGA